MVERVSQTGTGLQLVGHAGWLDLSKWADPPVDLTGLQPGDAVTLEVQTSQTGKPYIRSLRRGR